MCLRGSNKRPPLDFVEEKQYALNVREMRASAWKKRGDDDEASMRNDNAAFGCQKTCNGRRRVLQMTRLIYANRKSTRTYTL